MYKKEILLLLIIFFFSCRKDYVRCYDSLNPACENYDPCVKYKISNSNLSVCEAPYSWSDSNYYKYFPKWILYEVNDTIKGAELLVRLVNMDFKGIDSVRWFFNNGLFEIANDLTLFRVNVGALTDVRIKCIIYRRTNSCIKNNDSIVTLTKTLYSCEGTGKCLESKLQGVYSGLYNDNNGKLEQISIIFNQLDTSDGKYTYYQIFQNFIPDTYLKFIPSIEYFYSSMLEIGFTLSHYKDSLSGVAILKNDSTIFLDFDYLDQNKIKHNRKFNGTRVK